MTEHTPGPWEMIQLLNIPGGYTINASKTEPVATVKGAGLHRENSTANARLIAAAPDLLAALVDLRAAATAHGVAFNNPANVKARAAIAKARGT